MNTKLFVGNLSFNTTENDLQDAFAAHGTVTEANLMMDRTTGRPRGFAFVTMVRPKRRRKRSMRSTARCWMAVISPSTRLARGKSVPGAAFGVDTAMVVPHVPTAGTKETTLRQA